MLLYQYDRFEQRVRIGAVVYFDKNHITAVARQRTLVRITVPFNDHLIVFGYAPFNDQVADQIAENIVNSDVEKQLRRISGAEPHGQLHRSRIR